VIVRELRVTVAPGLRLPGHSGVSFRIRSSEGGMRKSTVPLRRCASAATLIFRSSLGNGTPLPASSLSPREPPAGVREVQAD